MRVNPPKLTAARCDIGDRVRVANSEDTRVFTVGAAPEMGLPGYINLIWKDKVALIVAGSQPVNLVEKALVLDTEEPA